MKLLKNTFINGEIYEEYAFLSYEFEFENSGGDAVVADYIFDIPQNSHISDMKIVTKDGRIIKTTVTAVSYIAGACCGETPYAVLRHAADGRCLLGIKEAAQGCCRIMIDVYTPLPRVEDEQRLVIPVSGLASIQIILNTEAEAISATHNIAEQNDGIRLIKAKADRDFCLVLRNAPMRNSAIAVRNDFDGEMLCKLYPSAQFYKETAQRFCRILFIYDGTGSLVGGAANAAREAILAMAEGFKKEYALVLAADTPRLASDGFVEYRADELIELLADVPKLGGSLAEAFEYAKQYIADDVLPVLVCGSRLIEGSYAAKQAAELLKESGMCAVTVGARAAAGRLPDAIGQCGGRCGSIFGADDVRKRALQLLHSFMLPMSDAIEVICHGADASIIGNSSSVYDGVSVYAAYRGEAKPKEFILKNGDVAERFVLEQIPTYKSFAPVRLVRAAELTRKAMRQLEFCSPDEVMGIRRYMEEVGVEFSALNSETALIASGGTTAEAIRVIVGDTRLPDEDVFRDRVSMFREAEVADAGERARLAEICTDVIIRSIRSDGAICAGGEIIRELRVKQTLICILALVASGRYEEFKGVIDAARNYIGEYELKDISFTSRADEAAELLRSLRQSAVFDEPTDILTAALLLADKC